MSAHHDTVGEAMTKAAAWVAAWFGTVAIADVQLWVSIVSGAAVAVLALINIYKALRDWGK